MEGAAVCVHVRVPYALIVVLWPIFYYHGHGQLISSNALLVNTLPSLLFFIIQEEVVESPSLLVSSLPFHFLSHFAHSFRSLLLPLSSPPFS